jgi:hypothetical protein
LTMNKVLGLADRRAIPFDTTGSSVQFIVNLKRKWTLDPLVAGRRSPPKAIGWPHPL